MKSGGGGGEGWDVKSTGDSRVGLIGFPSVGKSTLLTKLTGTHSEAAAYEFTTLTCIPGIIRYKGAKIQLLDLPGIIEGTSPFIPSLSLSRLQIRYINSVFCPCNRAQAPSGILQTLHFEVFTDCLGTRRSKRHGILKDQPCISTSLWRCLDARNSKKTRDVVTQAVRAPLSNCRCQGWQG